MMKKKVLLIAIMAGLAMLVGCSSKESIQTEEVQLSEKNEEKESENLMGNSVQGKNDVSVLDKYSITLSEAINNKGVMTYDSSLGGVKLIYNDKMYFPTFVGELPNAQIKQLVSGNGSEGVWTGALDIEGTLWSSGGPAVERSLYDADKDINYNGKIEKVIESGRFCFIFLKDGSCLISNSDTRSGLEREFDASNIEMAKILYDSSYSIMELKEDGTVQLQDFNEENPYFETDILDVSDWSDIKYIESVYLEGEAEYLIGIKSDGTLEVTGEGYPNEILEWTDLVDVQCHGNDVVALKSDGSLLCSNSLRDLAELVKDWSNIKVMLFLDKNHIGAISESGIYYNIGMPLNAEEVYEYNGSGYDGVRINEDTKEKWRNEMSFSLDDY